MKESNFFSVYQNLSRKFYKMGKLAYSFYICIWILLEKILQFLFHWNIFNSTLCLYTFAISFSYKPIFGKTTLSCLSHNFFDVTKSYFLKTSKNRNSLCISKPSFIPISVDHIQRSIVSPILRELKPSNYLGSSYKISNSYIKIFLFDPSKYGFHYPEGTEFLFGINPVFGALSSDRRQMYELLVWRENVIVIFSKAVVQDSKTPSKDWEKKMKKATAEAEIRKIPMKYVSKLILNLLCDNQAHQGLILAASPLSFIEIDCLQTQPDSNASSSTPPCWIALDEITDPHNFGSLVRTACFLGINGIVVSRRNSAPLSAVVSKVSAGAMETVVVHSTKNMVQFLENCKSRNWKIYGTSVQTANTTLLSQANVNQSSVIVFGNEGEGLRTNILRICDNIIHIGGSNIKSPTINSMNVGVAGGIIMHKFLQS